MLLDKTKTELKEYIASLNEPSFRANQLFDALLQAKPLKEISNLPAAFKEKVKEEYPSFCIAKKLKSRDGTIKYIFKFSDGEIVEGVLMRYKYGNTLCVSTQVGCRMGCTFCASGLNGLKRNLSAGEILQQVLLVNRDLGGDVKHRAVTNIVLMGMGEPLDNYENVTKFLRLVSAEEGLNISQRNITLSTCGIVPKIYQLADDGFSVTLTISLHAATDEERKQLLPIAQAYSIAEILSACKYYFEKTGRRFSFEYALVAGKNDNLQEADKLASLLKGLPCLVNLIPLNFVKEKNLRGSDEKRVQAFLDRLSAKGINATKRRTMGADIGGACGQLRRQLLKEDA